MSARVVILLLAGLLAAPSLAQPIEEASPAEGMIVVAPGVVIPDLPALARTRERPLFSPSRRAPDAPEEAAEAPPPEEAPAPPPGPPPFELAGVVTGGGMAAETGFAILRDRQTQAIERARQGETVKGWKLAELGAKHVVVVQEDRSVRLTLFEVREGEPPRRPPPSKRDNRSRDSDDDDDDEDE